MSARMMRVAIETDPPAVPGADALASTATASDAVLANRDVRDVAATTVSACFTNELNRRHADWRRTLTGVKDALAGLDRTCEAAINTLTETEAEPAAAMSTLVDTLVAAATANADAAVRRTRAAVQIEIADLQALVDRLQAELHAAREQVQTAREECDEEHRARGRADVARDEAQRAYSHLVSASESQLHGVQAAFEAERAVSFRLHQQLEAEHTERARLIAALQTVRRAVSFAEPAGPAPDLPRPLTPRHDVPDRPPADPEPAAAPEPPATSDDAPDPATAAAPPVTRTLTLAAHAPMAGAEAPFEPAVYLEHLLDEIEEMYCADLESALSASDVAKALAANLDYARDVFERRLGSAGVADTMLFERQLTMLLDTKSATSFGRHLAIAARESGLVAAARTRPSPIFRRAGDL